MIQNTKTAWSYYDHFKKVCDDKSSIFKSNVNYKSDLIQIAPDVESRITPVFNLLFSHLPNYLTHFMQIAVSYDSDIFERDPLQDTLQLLSRFEFSRIGESHMSSISRLSSLPIDDLVSNLDRVSRSESSFVNYLINLRTPDLLNALENVFQVNHYPSIIFTKEEKYRSRFLCCMLANVGSSRSLTASICGLHHKTISDIYCNSTDDYYIPFNKRKQLSAAAIMQSKEKANYIMLMLSLYTICCRVLTNKLPSANHLDQEDIPTRISYPIAIGVYQVCRNLSSLFNLKKFNLPKIASYMPIFDDFHEVLKGFVNRDAEAVACTHCYTPYLDLKQKPTKKDNFVPQTIPCPICNRTVEFSLNDF
jgi:hypothetical protein